MKKHPVLFLFLCLLLLACQPTPTEEAVVAPNGYEASIRDRRPQAEQAITVLAPDCWNEVMELRYWNVTIDADVSPNVIGAVPVYESAYVTMDDIREQANRVKRVLLRDTTAFCDAAYSKADWYRQIQLYADTPVWDDRTGGNTKYPTDEEVRTYTKDLSSFIDDAPLELEYRPFSPLTDAIPDEARYALSDGSFALMRCDPKSISALYGAELFFNAFDQTESQVLAGDGLLGEPVGTTIEGVKIDAKAAEEQALSFVRELSLDGFKIVKSEKARYVNEYTRQNVTVGYTVVLCRAEGGYETAGNTIPLRLQNRGERTEGSTYRPYWDWEQIRIFVDETGVRSFWWTQPTKRPQLINEAVEILPFEAVKEVIRTHLKNLLVWDEENLFWREDYAGRSKDLISHVGLYFGIIPKKNDVDAFYYGPVWIVTVLGYPADADVPATPYTMPVRYLHVNAIDGSLIDY